MKIGIGYEMLNPPMARRPWRELWEDYLRFFCEVEQLGFDFIGFEEHFFTSDGHGPTPTIFAAALIQRTSSIQIGSWANILPLHHPVLLAQEWATLDQLSGGRTFATLASGYRANEYQAFGLDPRTRPSRMEEGFALFRKALTQSTLSHQGKYWQLDNVSIMPEPIQNPYPVWGTAASIPAAQRAARHKLHLAATSMDPAVHDAYRQTLLDIGEDPANYRVSLPFSLHATREAPDAIWQRYRDLYMYRWSEIERYAPGSSNAAAVQQRPPTAEDEARYRSYELIGDPEFVLKTLDGVRNMIRLTDLINIGPVPGIDLRTVGLETMRLLSKEVLPVVHSW